MSRTASAAAFCVTALVGGLLLVASPALGQFRISGGVAAPGDNSGTRDSYFETRAVPFGDGVQQSGGQHLEGTGDYSYFVQTSGYAGAGFLGSTSNARYEQNFRAGVGSNLNWAGSNFAEFTLTDVIIRGTPGPVTTSLNFHLSGTQITSAINGPQIGENGDYGHATVQLQAVINGGISIGAGFKTYGTTYFSDGVDSSSGWLTDWFGDGDLTSSLFTVNANEFFTVMVQLQTGASANAYTGQFGGSSGSADFSHTASFATDGPVFNLPAGYDASSASAGLVDNTFSVPEPGPLLMLGAAATGLLPCRRRRGADR